MTHKREMLRLYNSLRCYSPHSYIFLITYYVFKGLELHETIRKASRIMKEICRQNSLKVRSNLISATESLVTSILEESRLWGLSWDSYILKPTFKTSVDILSKNSGESLSISVLGSLWDNSVVEAKWRGFPGLNMNWHCILTGTKNLTVLFKLQLLTAPFVLESIMYAAGDRTLNSKTVAKIDHVPRSIQSLFWIFCQR